MEMEAQQRAICAEFGSTFSPPDAQSKVGIALSTLEKLPLYAIRGPMEGTLCGWFIWGGEYSANDDFYDALCAAHLSKYCPEIVPYLALEPGWGVILAPNYRDVWFDERRLVLDDSSEDNS